MVTAVVRDCTRKRRLVSALFFRFYTQIIWQYVHQVNLISHCSVDSVEISDVVIIIIIIIITIIILVFCLCSFLFCN
jgi:hypothetical protein